jgi:hypothetical protein
MNLECKRESELTVEKESSLTQLMLGGIGEIDMIGPSDVISRKARNLPGRY